MKKTGPKKLTLSRETIVDLEKGKLVGADGGFDRGGAVGVKFSDNWEQTTCM